MKLDYVNNSAIQKLVKRGSLLLATGFVLSTMSGCSREIATNSSVKYDVIDTMDEELATSGIQQVLDVPGQDFDLVVDYHCILDENAKWTVTSDKEMYMNIHTEGLDDNKKVYIDNVHTDTTIRSIYPSVDGIKQDTMDDRIHNSLMLGIPISDDNSYSSINCIEGQNQTFMEGSFYGFSGYTSGTIRQQRYVESDYLAAGVYANKISSAIDLIVVNEDGTETYTSVPSTIGVSVWPYVERRDSSGNSIFRYYYYDDNKGKIEYKDYNEEEYNQLTRNSGRHR